MVAQKHGAPNPIDRPGRVRVAACWPRATCLAPLMVAPVATWPNVPVGMGPVVTLGPDPRPVGMLRAGLEYVPTSCPMLMLLNVALVALSEVASTTRPAAVAPAPGA